MKILSLRIQNINSLKGDNFIDFNAYPLKNTGLFAITGPTGAGKSTILDAITLALYNYVPRNGKLSKSNIAKYGAIITRGTKSCYSEIEYQVGEGVFRSKWSIGMARTGSLRDYDMEISKQDINGDFNILDFKKGNVPGENSRLIGLSEDQFVKSIMLSQGEFTRFLKAKAKDRSELLESITGTEIYRKIGLSAFAKNKLEKEKLEFINVKLNGVDLLSAQELEEKNMSEKNIISELKVIDAEQQKVEQLLSIKKEILQKTKEKDALLLEYQSIGENIENKKADFHRLLKHESILHIKGDLLRFKDLEDSLNHNKIKDEKLQKEIIALSEKLLLATKEYEISTTELESSDKEKDSSVALFKIIREYDANIKLSSEELHTSAKRLKKLQSSKENLLVAIKENDNIISELTDELLNRNKWIKENSLLEKAENDVLRIEEKLYEMNNKFHYLKQELEMSDHKEIYSFVSKNKIELSLSFINKKIKDNEANTLLLSDKIKTCKYKNKQELSVSQDVFSEEILQVSSLKEMQNNFLASTKLKNNNAKDVDLLLLKKTEIESDLKGKIKLSEVLKLYVSELEIKKQRLILESSFDSHRAKLMQGQACPLCGSLEHPFVNSYVSSIDNTAKELDKKKLELDNIISKINKINIESENIQTRVDEKFKQTELLNNDISANSDLFINNKIVGKYELIITDKEKLSLLEKNIEDKRSSLKLYYSLFENLEDISTNLEYLRNVSLKIKDIDTLNKSTLGMLNVYRGILPDGILSDGILSEKIKTLSLLYDKYKLEKQMLDSLDKKLIQNTTSKEGFIKQIYELEENIKSDNNDLLKQEHVCNLHKQKRMLAFADKDVDQEQENIERKHKQINSSNIKAKELLDALKSDSKFKKESIKILSEEYLDLETKLLVLKGSLSPKLNVLDYSNAYDALSCLLNDNIYKQLKESYDNLNKQKLENNKLIDTTNDKIVDLTNKDDKEVLLDSLETKLRDLKSQSSLFNQNLGSISEILKKHSANLILQKDVLVERDLQAKECNRWDLLNELIGDAKGDKYSKFAQELTLQQMLSLANKHLLKLNKRYLLKYDSKRNDDLLVVDLLQGNDERSVSTLSGGESFLISLALALGLSDLAGQNTQIESLFIDEGFGTLDQETLDSALSTLETLQAESNRTIGIISHVSALKERISTQIELQKDSQGYSTIKIV